MIPSRSTRASDDPIARFNSGRRKAAATNVVCILLLLIVLVLLPPSTPSLSLAVWAKVTSGFALTAYYFYVVIMFRWSMPMARAVFPPTIPQDYPRALECVECGQPLEMDKTCSFCALDRARPLIFALGSLLCWAAPLLWLIRPVIMEALPSAPVLAFLDGLILVSALGPAASYVTYLAAVKPGRTKRW